MLSLGFYQLKYMRLFFSILFFLFYSGALLAESFETKYIVKTKGLTIGSLDWVLEINNDKYQTSIDLSSKGLLSGLFKFSGFYVAKGRVENEKLLPLTYIQKWETKKKSRDVKIIFNNLRGVEIFILPEEKELARVKYNRLKGFKDPLTSFINIMLGSKTSDTIDGRRVYRLLANKEKNKTKILIKNYKNIWADHNRNDLEHIEMFLNEEDVLPNKINIMFKGSIFSLIKD